MISTKITSELNNRTERQTTAMKEWIKSDSDFTVLSHDLSPLQTLLVSSLQIFSPPFFVHFFKSFRPAVGGATVRLFPTDSHSSRWLSVDSEGAEGKQKLCATRVAYQQNGRQTPPGNTRKLAANQWRLGSFHMMSTACEPESIFNVAVAKSVSW